MSRRTGRQGMKRILVVEDDQPILAGLVDLLKGEGYDVFSATDGSSALDLFGKTQPDLVLLDIMIPELSGYDVCREIRKTDMTTPVLMLTAKGQEVDKVLGLELGADDYIVKPFGVNELLARIRAALRRSEARQDDQDRPGAIEFGDVTVDPRTMRASKGGKEFPVSKREVELLQYLWKNEGNALDRQTLLKEIWGLYYEGTTRTLDQHIAKLRQKIEDDPSKPRYIITVHGVGYRFQG
jgi:DNA-binding response OmpR family regulator